MLEEARAEAGLQSHVAALVGAQSPEAVCQGSLAESRGLALTTHVYDNVSSRDSVRLVLQICTWLVLPEEQATTSGLKPLTQLTEWSAALLGCLASGLVVASSGGWFSL